MRDSSFPKWKIIIQDVEHNLLPYVKDLAEEYNCSLEEKWQSNYNEYVCYDYEPFCREGFALSVTLTSTDLNKASFVKHLYLKRKNSIDRLKRMLDKTKKIGDEK